MVVIGTVNAWGIPVRTAVDTAALVYLMFLVVALYYNSGGRNINRYPEYPEGEALTESTRLNKES